MEKSLYSVRMRASSLGRHLAGAERLVAGVTLSAVTAALMQRAMRCPDGPADEIHCSVERIEPQTVHYAALPNLTTYEVQDWQAGRRAAHCLLVRAGVPSDIAARALSLLANGAGPEGSVMRGAALLDVATGERLETDPGRGVRVSRMDLAPEFRPILEHNLASAGLDHHRVQEALVLAGKVLRAPGIVAELCWSDAADYTTGYVAAPQFGYQRITALKPAGDRRGGRVFFVNQTNISLAALIDYLERQAILFNASGAISPPGKWMARDE
jgi:6-carboxyhexanoate--CoA ligase